MLLITLCSILAVSGCIIGNDINNGSGCESSSSTTAAIYAVNAMAADAQKDAYLALAKKGATDGMREYEWKALIETVEHSALSTEQKTEVLNYIISNKNVKPCLQVKSKSNKKCN